MTGYDELLHARVDQLKVIEERLETIWRRLDRHGEAATLTRQLQFDLRDMIAAAEREHAEF